MIGKNILVYFLSQKLINNLKNSYESSFKTRNNIEKRVYNLNKCNIIYYISKFLLKFYYKIDYL